MNYLHVPQCLEEARAMKETMGTTIRLTCREVEVLRLLARGCTYIQVGDRLRMSVHTVESHVKNLYRKLNVHSARAAVWRATELRLLGEADGLQQASPEVSWVP